MEKIYHEELTRSALDAVFSRGALDAIVTANLGQDSLLNLLKSRYHFDDNDFDGAFAYAEAQEAAVVAALRDKDQEAAWAAFGRLTHAAQDFYAHTNYVALWLEAHPDFDADAGLPVDPVDPKIVYSDALIAAHVYYPLEALTIFDGLVPALQRILPADSHANMNLDHPGRGDLFPLAMSAARARTQFSFGEISALIAAEMGADGLALFQDRPIDKGTGDG
jgi:hypothetical protein